MKQDNETMENETVRSEAMANETAEDEAEEEVEEEVDILQRKVGIARFFELLGRDFISFYKSSFLFLLGALPGFLLMYFGIMAGSLLLAVLGGALGGLIGSPLLCGMYDTALRALRDEPGYWWHTYKNAWKQNWRQSLLPGVVLGVVLGGWAWVMIRLPDMEEAPTSVWVCEVVGIVMLMGLCNYFYSQLVLLSLDIGTMARNTIAFFVGFLPRSMAAAVVTVAYWVLIMLYLPYTVVVLMITGVWMPVVISLLCIYPALNKTLSLEERINTKREEDLR